MTVHYKVLAVIAGVLIAVSLFSLLTLFKATLVTAVLAAVIGGLAVGLGLALFWQRSFSPGYSEDGESMI